MKEHCFIGNRQPCRAKLQTSNPQRARTGKLAFLLDTVANVCHRQACMLGLHMINAKFQDHAASFLQLAV